LYFEIFKLLLVDKTSPVSIFTSVNKCIVVGGYPPERFSLSITQVRVEGRGHNAVEGDFIDFSAIVRVVFTAARAAA